MLASTTKAIYGGGVRYSLNEQAGICCEYNKFVTWESLAVSAICLGADTASTF